MNNRYTNKYTAYKDHDRTQQNLKYMIKSHRSMQCNIHRRKKNQRVNFFMQHESKPN